jgi:hypothetical protein
MTIKKLSKQPQLNVDELRLTPKDFSFNEAGDLVINYNKITQIINNRSIKRESLKVGVSPR